MLAGLALLACLSICLILNQVPSDAASPTLTTTPAEEASDVRRHLLMAKVRK